MPHAPRPIDRYVRTDRRRPVGTHRKHVPVTRSPSGNRSNRTVGPSRHVLAKSPATRQTPEMRRLFAIVTATVFLTVVPSGVSHAQVVGALACSNQSGIVLFYPSALVPTQVGAIGSGTCFSNTARNLCIRVDLRRSNAVVATKSSCLNVALGKNAKLSAATGLVRYQRPNSAYSVTVTYYGT
jgi:hypothetical protein